MREMYWSIKVWICSIVWRNFKFALLRHIVLFFGKFMNYYIWVVLASTSIYVLFSNDPPLISFKESFSFFASTALLLCLFFTLFELFYGSRVFYTRSFYINRELERLELERENGHQVDDDYYAFLKSKKEKIDSMLSEMLDAFRAFVSEGMMTKEEFEGVLSDLGEEWVSKEHNLNKEKK